MNNINPIIDIFLNQLIVAKFDNIDDYQNAFKKFETENPRLDKNYLSQLWHDCIIRGILRGNMERIHYFSENICKMNYPIDNRFYAIITNWRYYGIATTKDLIMTKLELKSEDFPSIFQIYLELLKEEKIGAFKIDFIIKLFKNKYQ